MKWVVCFIYPQSGDMFVFNKPKFDTKDECI